MKPVFTLDQKLPTDLKKISPFIDRVCREIFELTADKKQAYNIKLVLEEALTNAMRHGNKLKLSAKVKVLITADRARITADIHDQGSGFDFNGLADPTQGANTQRPSGRGVFLMRKLMDSVEFYDNGSGVRMTKKFPAG